MSTPHNEAKVGDFAKTVLMPGDPLRAKFIAETFLKDYRQVNSVRNMLAFTGYYNGKKVSVMGNKDLELFDLVIASGACTNSNWIQQYDLPKGTFSAIADYSTLEAAVNSARKRNYRYKVGNILSSDNFYNDPEAKWKKWASMGVLCVEMEAYALYSTAASLNKEALTICSISDSFITHKETTSEERVTSFTHMMEVALDCIKE